MHLINPPDGESILDSREPQVLRNVRVSLEPPPGWKPTRAWLVGAERQRPFVETVVGRTRRKDGRDEPYLERWCAAEGVPSAEALPLDGATVRVPELKLWGLVAFECDGPAADVPPPAANPIFPAPQVPDTAAPIQASRASEFEFAKLGVPAMAARGRKNMVADTVASAGRAARLETSLAVRVQRNPGLNWGWVQPIPTGRYRVTVNCRASQVLSGSLTLNVSTANEAHAQNKFPKVPKFEGRHTWDLAGVPVDRYGRLSVEMKWEEMPCQAELRLESSTPGLLLQELLIECLQVLDTERVKSWGDGWPAGTKLAAHSGKNVWFGLGLYSDYFRLDQAFQDLPAPVTIDCGIHFKVGQHPTGFQEAGFPSVEKLPNYDLLIIGDVDLMTFRPPERDRLRGWVEAGGRLLLLGGPYGFGSGDWHLSDLLTPLYPAELSGRFDLQPVGAEKAAHLEPAGTLLRQLDWSKPPAVLWQHIMKAKSDATVHARAGAHPAVLSRTYGKGKVCFIAIAPLGEAAAGQTAFWDWPQWPLLMKTVVKELLQ